MITKKETLITNSTSHSPAVLLQQISSDRTVSSPFTSHAGVPAQARPDERPKPGAPNVTRSFNQNKKSTASKKANGPPVAEDCSNEPFISTRAPKDGLPRYCVQIRRRTQEGPINVSKTFSSLEHAKKWRDDTLARMQLGRSLHGKKRIPRNLSHGYATQSRKGRTKADASVSPRRKTSTV